MTEITVGAWLKQDGDWVEKDEAICEIESDKATLEVGAPNDGILSISAQEGDELDVGAVLGTVEPGEKPAGASPAENPPNPPKRHTPKSPRKEAMVAHAPVPSRRRSLRNVAWT